MRAAEGRGLDDVEDPALPIAVAGLRAIGLTVIEDDAAVGFVPGVRIAGGTLRYAPGATDSNLLHEAGHLAILPENLRPLAEDDLSGVWEAIRGEFQTARCADPDAPYPRADQCSDPEATAWAFAAGRQFGLAPEQIIRDQDYDGDGAGVRFGLEHNAYAGIHGLRHAGFLARVRDFPKLERWLQRGFQSRPEIARA